VNETEKSAATVEELIALTKDTSVRRITVRGDLAKAPSIRLSPGQSPEAMTTPLRFLLKRASVVTQ